MTEGVVRRLNWGCGGSLQAGWVNSDRRPGRGVDVVCDILEGLPLDADSIDYAVSIHALQEVAYASLVPALQELRRVLRPGGVLRMVLPDLDKGIQAYLRKDRDYFLILDEEVKSVGAKFIVHLLWYGYSRMLFTGDLVEELLLKAGFGRVHRCGFRETASPFPDIVALDNRERESLYVEGVKQMLAVHVVANQILEIAAPVVPTDDAQSREWVVSEARYLIVNADDFGLSPGVNRGIVAAHERGIVTSASLMVRWPAAAEAAAYARRRPELSVGLHVDVGEWVCRGGIWVTTYEVVYQDDGDAMATEAATQLARFRQLTGRDPTHLDSHQHVHRHEPLRSVLTGMARALGVPLRHVDPGVAHCGDFYGQTATGEPYPQGVSVEGLLTTLARLPPGVTELGCHPGEGADIASVYAAERADEVTTLCDPRLKAALPALGINLRSFHSRRDGSL